MGLDLLLDLLKKAIDVKFCLSSHLDREEMALISSNNPDVYSTADPLTALHRSLGFLINVIYVVVI